MTRRQNDTTALRKTKTAARYFAVAYLLFFAGTLALILLYDKHTLHLLLNTHHTPYGDLFFKYFTHIGGGVPVVVAVLLLFLRIRDGLYLFATLLLNLLLTNTLKLIFGVPRPVPFFNEHFPDISLPLVEGVTIHYHNGFPSGHTSAVFALMTALSLIVGKKYVSLLCFVLALLGAYSRIYLSQHFAEDILLGSAIGCAVAAALYPLYLKAERLYPRTNGSLPALFRKNAG